ncbi:DUF1616 domain-containing protein [Halorussus lipolyticus]|uniref:DUF1616 domain-containing protein n=1 Tax=Halorussus lipolyticus TaxID=3034024 RepID=UPI0023E8EECD|nr:DUF1616 domain-containing protein [Halorussus sp. DT80]
MAGDQFVADRLSPDLAAVAVSPFVLGIVTLVPGRLGAALRLVVGFPFVFFASGYALVVALFPEKRAIETVERTLLTVVASLLAVTAVGVLLNVSPWPISTRNLLLGLSAATLLGVVAATVRRPDAEESGRNDRSGVRERFRNRTLLDAAVVAAVLLAAGTVAYTSYGERGDGFTEAYLLTPNESDELVAATGEFGAQSRVQSQARTRVVFGLENHEKRRVRYTVVVRRQQVSETGAGRRGEASLDEGRIVSRFSQQVDAGGNWRVNDVLRPPDRERIRVSYLVYRGDPPANSSVANAYREVHLWLPNPPPGNQTG